MRKWVVRVGFTEEETFNQRPEGADGGSRRTLGKNLAGRRKGKNTCPRGKACLHERKYGWSRGARGEC